MHPQCYGSGSSSHELQGCVCAYAMSIPAPGSACGATEVTSLCLLQLCEKEDEELAERSEHDSGINEEPLLTAEQVPTP